MLRCHISISLDGCVAGPNQSEGNPLGEGGEQLHSWIFPLAAWRQSHGKQLYRPQALKAKATQRPVEPTVRSVRLYTLQIPPVPAV
jgi:hypothetical protein